MNIESVESLKNTGARTSPDDSVNTLHIHEETPESGAVMPNGSVYVGVSPDTNTALYLHPRRSEKILTLGQAFMFAKTMNAQYPDDETKLRIPTNSEWKSLYKNRDQGALKNIFNEIDLKDRFWAWPHSEDEIIVRSGVWSPAFEQAAASDILPYHPSQASHASAYVVYTDP